MEDYGMSASVGDWLTELIDHRVDRPRGWEYLRGGEI